MNLGVKAQWIICLQLVLHPALVQVGVQAYILWEKAGKPDGADFSNDARGMLQDQLNKGATIEHLEKSLKAPSPKEPEPVPEQATTQPPPPPELPQSSEAEVRPVFSLTRGRLQPKESF